MGELSSQIRSFIRSNRVRSVLALSFLFLSFFLSFINLSVASSHPSSHLSWSRFTSRVDVNIGRFISVEYDVGLLSVQACRPDTGSCATSSLSAWERGDSCSGSGRYVIAAYAFAFLFSAAAVFIGYYNGAHKERIPSPRQLLTVCLSLSALLYIVALAVWLNLCHSVLAASAIQSGDADLRQPLSSLATGYSVVLAVLSVLLALLGCGFQLWLSYSPSEAASSDGFSPLNAPSSPEYVRAEDERPERLQASGTYAAAPPAFIHPQYAQPQQQRGGGRAVGGGGWGGAAAQQRQPLRASGY